VIVCCPDRTKLCETCLAGSWDNLRGTAACRGELWADRVACSVPRSRAWPAHEGKAAAIARRKVEDLTRDDRLLEMLAAELARWAARRWRLPVEVRLV
jgi:hypothetical protein